MRSLKTNDLQILIDLCYQYSRKWRFIFGINKTHCMISNKNPFIKYPSWNLGGHKIKNAETLEILGTMFTSNISCDAHIDKRVNASRRAMYALASVGCSYPGLATEVKVHLWKTIGLPSLLYNLEIFKLKPGQQKFIESVQSSIIKRIVGFPKRPITPLSSRQLILMTSCHRSPVTHCHYGGDSFKLITPPGSYKLN